MVTRAITLIITCPIVRYVAYNVDGAMHIHKYSPSFALNGNNCDYVAANISQRVINVQYTVKTPHNNITLDAIRFTFIHFALDLEPLKLRPLIIHQFNNKDSLQCFTIPQPGCLIQLLT